MTGLSTDATLLDALKRAARIELSAEEIREQKISFIMGSLDEDSTVTREQIVEIIFKHEGSIIHK